MFVEHHAFGATADPRSPLYSKTADTRGFQDIGQEEMKILFFRLHKSFISVLNCSLSKLCGNIGG